MPWQLDLFSDDKLALLQELRSHPKLHAELLAYDQRTEWPEMLGHIAAYVGIVMDDAYTAEDLERLHGILYHKLRDRIILL